MKIEQALKGRPSIFCQAAMAMMLIQFVHKIVREIPGAIKMEGSGAIAVPLFAGLLAVGILLIALKNKWGLIFGIIDGVFMIFQPVLVHVILAHPEKNGVWWYPIFPWTQAVLIIYFCCLAWKNWSK
ncbi:MAG: hypothetical protein K8R67_05870 [Desulfobacteraceae bacterium]|nr:hypothetical protein [Desulfobacteraceae bacterium]